MKTTHCIFKLITTDYTYASLMITYNKKHLKLELHWTVTSDYSTKYKQ